MTAMQSITKYAELQNLGYLTREQGAELSRLEALLRPRLRVAYVRWARAVSACALARRGFSHGLDRRQRRSALRSRSLLAAAERALSHPLYAALGAQRLSALLDMCQVVERDLSFANHGG